MHFSVQLGLSLVCETGGQCYIIAKGQCPKDKILNRAFPLIPYCLIITHAKYTFTGKLTVFKKYKSRSASSQNH